MQLNRHEKRYNVVRKTFHSLRGVWNSFYLDRAVRHLREQGEKVREEDLARVTPLLHAHINVLGRTSSPWTKEVAEGGTCPLQDPTETTSISLCFPNLATGAADGEPCPIATQIPMLVRERGSSLSFLDPRLFSLGALQRPHPDAPVVSRDEPSEPAETAFEVGAGGVPERRRSREDRQPRIFGLDPGGERDERTAPPLPYRALAPATDGAVVAPAQKRGMFGLDQYT